MTIISALYPKKNFQLLFEKNKNRYNFLNSRSITTDLGSIKPPKIEVHLHLVTNSEYVKSIAELYFVIKEVVEAIPKEEKVYIQLRFREDEDHSHTDLGKELVRDMHAWNPNVKLIINDRVDIACIIKADGVHVGPTDVQPDEAKGFLKKNLSGECIVGYTINSHEDMVKHNNNPNIDYFGLQIRSSQKSKPRSLKIWDEDEWKRMIDGSKKPVVIIGGITLETLPEDIKLLRDGDGFAICGEIMRAKDITKIIKSINEIKERVFGRNLE